MPTPLRENWKVGNHTEIIRVW